MQEYRVTVDPQGAVCWYDLKTDLLHRVDGPAVEFSNGTKSWFINGKRHRIDGPAIEYAHGSKDWYVNGKRHRVDGPAVEYADGTKAWYLDDVEYSESEFNAKMNPSSCEGREIEIDGVTYTLKEKE